MSTQPLRRRRSIRLASWDYTRPAVYFVTICTYQRQYLLTPSFTEIVTRVWQAIPHHPAARHVVLDEWVIMPNHLHGLIILTDSARPEPGAPMDVADMPFPLATRYAEEGPPLREARLVSGSLGAVVNNFKATATRQINNVRRARGCPVWQRGYYERIVRNPRELEATRRYIRENPRRWAEDRDNLDALLERMNTGP